MRTSLLEEEQEVNLPLLLCRNGAVAVVVLEVAIWRRSGVSVLGLASGKRVDRQKERDFRSSFPVNSTRGDYQINYHSPGTGAMEFTPLEVGWVSLPRPFFRYCSPSGGAHKEREPIFHLGNKLAGVAYKWRNNGSGPTGLSSRSGGPRPP